MEEKSMRLESVPLNKIRIADDFWGRYMRLVTDKILPYQWEVLNDRVSDAEPSHCISNFEIAAGRKKGEFQGFVFQDTDLAKWIEAAAYSLAFAPDHKLEQTVDEAIELIGEAQCPDGYINTYFTVKEPEGRFKNLSEGHELYTAGHMMEAAVAYYEVTGKDRFLKIMCRMADLLCDVFFSKAYEHGVPGHQEVEIGLVKLYRVTGNRRYLELAKAFIDRRGVEPNYLATEKLRPDWVDVFHNPDPYIPEYAQSDEPVKMQKTARGHAVRAVYMYSAMADLAYEYDDQELLRACETLYEDIVGKQMYITGGIGQSGLYERFTTDFDLPNDRNYSETCASIGLALFCRRMAQITHDEKYVSTMETALCNTVLAGIALDGESFFYVNPLEVWPDNLLPYTSMAHVKAVRQKWFPCACCPPNIARTLASLGEYAVSVLHDSVWINMFVGCEFEMKVCGAPVIVKIESAMPFEGKVKIAVRKKRTGEDDSEPSEGSQTEDIGALTDGALTELSLMLRIPSYAKNSRISVCTKDADDSSCGNSGYQEQNAVALEISATGIGREPETGSRQSFRQHGNDHSEGSFHEIRIPLAYDHDTTVIYEFDMPAEFIYANSNVRADAGKVAVVKGPMVYAAEQIDNGANLAAFEVDTEQGITEEYRADLLGGCMMLTVHGYRLVDDEPEKLYSAAAPKKVPAVLKLIPYAYWNNRGQGEMTVWMRKH